MVSADIRILFARYTRLRRQPRPRLRPGHFSTKRSICATGESCRLQHPAQGDVQRLPLNAAAPPAPCGRLTPVLTAYRTLVWICEPTLFDTRPILVSNGFVEIVLNGT